MRHNRRSIPGSAFGIACWLAAGALFLSSATGPAAAQGGGGPRWTMTAPFPNQQFLKTASSVSGYGGGPLYTGYSFNITQHGLGATLANATGTTSWSGFWGATAPAPTGGWPVGLANAAIHDGTSYVVYNTIEFVN